MVHWWCCLRLSPLLCWALCVLCPATTYKRPEFKKTKKGLKRRPDVGRLWSCTKESRVAWKARFIIILFRLYRMRNKNHKGLNFDPTLLKIHTSVSTPPHPAAEFTAAVLHSLPLVTCFSWEVKSVGSDLFFYLHFTSSKRTLPDSDGPCGWAGEQRRLRPDTCRNGRGRGQGPFHDMHL